MKASFKDNSTVLFWLLGFIIVVLALVYFVFAKPKAAGMLTSGVQIVKADDVQQIEICKKYHNAYALKTQENNKFYLKYYYFENNKPMESKLEATNEQIQKLSEGNKYWLMINFTKKGDSTKGTIKEVLTENPAQK